MNLQKLKKSVLEVIEELTVGFVVIMAVYVVIAFPVEVSGASMSPNLETGDRLLVEKVTKYFEPFERGDIVVLHPPENDYIDYVKRVIALPGETIKIYGCQINISREDSKYSLNEEVYLNKEICTNGGKKLIEGRIYTLKDNEYIVLGDNRPNSQDSRAFGIVNGDRIQGKVVARFWPPDKVRLY